MIDAELDGLLAALEARFEGNAHRHEGIAWVEVRARIEGHPDGLRSLLMMEASGGEPDVTGIDASTGAIRFVDCAPESPAGRRSTCYDGEARRGRKKFPPERSAREMAAEMGAELLDEAEYLALQETGPFDTKTSSWILTPPAVRELGGAIFGDRRFGRVFIYHNGADSYYAARGFRCGLTI